MMRHLLERRRADLHGQQPPLAHDKLAAGPCQAHTIQPRHEVVRAVELICIDSPRHACRVSTITDSSSKEPDK